MNLLNFQLSPDFGSLFDKDSLFSSILVSLKFVSVCFVVFLITSTPLFTACELLTQSFFKELFTGIRSLP